MYTCTGILVCEYLIDKVNAIFIFYNITNIYTTKHKRMKITPKLLLKFKQTSILVILE